MFSLARACSGVYKVYGALYAVPATLVCGDAKARYDLGGYHLAYKCPVSQLGFVAHWSSHSGQLSASIVGRRFIVDALDQESDANKAAIRVCEALSLVGRIYTEIEEERFDERKYIPAQPYEDHQPTLAFTVDGFLVEIF